MGRQWVTLKNLWKLGWASSRAVKELVPSRYLGCLVLTYSFHDNTTVGLNWPDHLKNSLTLVSLRVSQFWPTWPLSWENPTQFWKTVKLIWAGYGRRFCSCQFYLAYSFPGVLR
jgi:hypothetical protein